MRILTSVFEANWNTNKERVSSQLALQQNQVEEIFLRNILFWLIIGSIFMIIFDCIS